MTIFRYCPECGAGLPLGNRFEKTCPRCGRTWYENPAPTVGVAIVRDGRALVTVRAREPEKGRIDVPGGFLHAGEEALEGLRREVREELGIDIDVGESDFLQAAPHRYGSEGDWVLSLGFKARWIGGEPQPADDVADVRWVQSSEVSQLEFACEHDRDLILKALEAEASEGRS